MAADHHAEHSNRNRRRRPELLRNPDAATTNASGEVGYEEASGFDEDFDAAVESALIELSDPFRAVVELVDIRGLSYAEAARELAVPVGTVMSRLHRARRRMRDHLEKAGVGPRSKP